MRIRNNKVNVFLSDDEKFILKRDSSKLNLSQSEYIRNLIIGYEVKNPEVKEETKNSIDEYIIEKIFKTLDENINCLIKVKNKFHYLGYFENEQAIGTKIETLNPDLYNRVKGADYVMHEAFCLDSEESIFHAYEKNHSTAKSASEVMNKLKVKNLILYHTEESHREERKMLYTNEGQEHFKGNVIVPNELDIIEII